jgi:hypothetical protein
MEYQIFLLPFSIYSIKVYIHRFYISFVVKWTNLMASHTSFSIRVSTRMEEDYCCPERSRANARKDMNVLAVSTLPTRAMFSSWRTHNVHHQGPEAIEIYYWIQTELAKTRQKKSSSRRESCVYWWLHIDPKPCGKEQMPTTQSTKEEHPIFHLPFSIYSIKVCIRWFHISFALKWTYI